MTNSESINVEKTPNQFKACTSATGEKDRSICAKSDDEEFYKPFSHLPDPAFGAELIWWEMLLPDQRCEISKQEVDLAEIQFQLQLALKI